MTLNLDEFEAYRPFTPVTPLYIDVDTLNLDVVKRITKHIANNMTSNVGSIYTTGYGPLFKQARKELVKEVAEDLHIPVNDLSFKHFCKMFTTSNKKEMSGIYDCIVFYETNEKRRYSKFDLDLAEMTRLSTLPKPIIIVTPKYRKANLLEEV